MKNYEFLGGCVQNAEESFNRLLRCARNDRLDELLRGVGPLARHCEEHFAYAQHRLRDEAISGIIRGLFRGVYTEHIRFSQCRLRECARNDKQKEKFVGIRKK